METPRHGEPRPAATVIAARDGGDGIEVLVLERSPGSRFLPGYVVFPGGAVDAGDEELARRWFGDASEAARACAIRELAEETGLTLTSHGLQPHADGAVDEAPPAADALHQISHWIAPEEVPVRFDARFFAVSVANGAQPNAEPNMEPTVGPTAKPTVKPNMEPTADGAEAERAWWADPRALLSEYHAGTTSLYWPTFKMMEALAGCSSIQEVLTLDVPQDDGDEEDE
ncbi:MAG TPA: NUDIX domain-containing protein [Actinomycetota bacterium]|jgi:8-oxo-dGTP pyrophosphatase MutT (NUDIX family)